jgi:hypothetical protein
MSDRGSIVERTTQSWVKATGRRIDFEAATWLEGPRGDVDVIADRWVEREAARLGATISHGRGLLSAFDALRADDFDPSRVHSAVTDFYERTNDYRLEVWAQWSAIALPVGWFLTAVFAQRLRQLALPLRPLDVAQGMDSRVLSIERSGQYLGSAWLRTLRSTGQTVYSGWYTVSRLPQRNGPSVKVVFPLPNGSITVFLRPSVDDRGALVLTSPRASFGEDGAYLVVYDDNGHAGYARRVPLVERIPVYVDDENVLRTDHAVSLRSVPIIKLHYRLERHA